MSSATELVCVICGDVIVDGLTLPCGHSYDTDCLKGWLSSLQQSGRPYVCVADGCGKEIPSDVLTRLGFRALSDNQIPCPVLGHTHVTDFVPGPAGVGNLTHCSLNPEATFCAFCKISPHHYETTSCEQAEKTRKAWEKLRAGINMYNSNKYPGPRPAQTGAAAAAISCPPPADYSSLRHARDYIVQNRELALQRIRSAPKNDIIETMITNLEGPALPRSRPALLRMVDFVDQIVNGDPRNVVVGGMYGGAFASDEAWKIQNCRYCPRCKRLINRTEGCDNMKCGRDYHGTGQVVGGCGQEFDWKRAEPYVSEDIIDTSIIQELEKDDKPQRETIVNIGGNGYKRKCQICNVTQKNMYLCTSLEPALIFCFHCLSASHGSSERLRIGKERASRLSGVPAERVLLPADRTYTWISI